MYDIYSNPYSNPYAQRLSQMQSQQRSEVIRVNGKNGAEAYQLAPNSSVLMLDTSAPIVWLAETDGAGYKTVSPFTITPYKSDPPIDTKSLDERITRLEEIINAQSDTSSINKKNAKAKSD